MAFFRRDRRYYLQPLLELLRLLRLLGGDLHVLRCGEGKECAPDELVSLVRTVAQHAGERRVHLEDGTVDTRIGNAHRGHHEPRAVRYINVQPCRPAAKSVSLMRAPLTGMKKTAAAAAAVLAPAASAHGHAGAAPHKMTTRR